MGNFSKTIGLFLIVLLNVTVSFAEIYTEHLDEIADANVHGVFYYNTLLDDDNSWRNDTSKSWYKEPFDPSDSFYGTVLDPHRWQEYTNNGATIEHNYKLIFDTNGYKTGWLCGIYNNDLWEIGGDFSIQVDFENFSASGTSGGIGLYVYKDTENYFSIRRALNSTHRYDSELYVNGSSTNYTHENTNDTVGKLRIARSNSDLYAYYWDGSTSSWVFLANTSAPNLTGNLFVSLEVDASNLDCSVELDNFIKTAGSTTFGQNGSFERSTLQAFPERALLVCHDAGFDILNADDKSMWMRFDINGSIGDAKHQNIVADIVEKVWAKNGQIFLGSSFGLMAGVCVIDFKEDSAWFYGCENNCWDYLSSIARRNFIKGWEINDTYPYLVGAQVFDFSVKTINNKQYLATATETGVTVINIEQNYKKDDYGDRADAITIGQDGALYYNSGSFLCKDDTSWRPENGNGEFTADYSTVISSPIRTLATTLELLFIGTQNGISKRSVNDISTQIFPYSTSNGLLGRTSNDVSSITIGKNTIWAGTSGSGGCISIINFQTDSFGSYLCAEPNHGDLSDNDIKSLSYYECDGMCSELLVGTANGSDLLSGCLGDVYPPEEIYIDIANGNVNIQWSSVECATSYSVYSSENPYENFSLEAAGLTETNWSEAVNNDKKFYQVTSCFFYDPE